jgi:2'-deoxynucleoside 5'-phosphate N-hydrolase
MIIYCAGPIRGNKKYQSDFKEIIDYVKLLGHTALSELNEEFKTAVPLTERQIFKRDIKWIEKSKLLISEASGASLGVGFEISYALYKHQIPVLSLINKNEDNASAMILGCSSELLTVKRYSDTEQIKKIISDFINKYAE